MERFPEIVMSKGPDKVHNLDLMKMDRVQESLKKKVLPVVAKICGCVWNSTGLLLWECFVNLKQIFIFSNCPL